MASAPAHLHSSDGGINGINLAGVIKRTHRPFNNSDTSVPNLSGHGGEITSYTWANDAFGRATRPLTIESKIGSETTARITRGTTSATVAVVSHDLDALGALCPRAVWISGGRVAADGASGDVIAAYRAESAAVSSRAL